MAEKRHGLRFFIVDAKHMCELASENLKILYEHIPEQSSLLALTRQRLHDTPHCTARSNDALTTPRSAVLCNSLLTEPNTLEMLEINFLRWGVVYTGTTSATQLLVNTRNIL